MPWSGLCLIYRSCPSWGFEYTTTVRDEHIKPGFMNEGNCASCFRRQLGIANSSPFSLDGAGLTKSYTDVGDYWIRPLHRPSRRQFIYIRWLKWHLWNTMRILDGIAYIIWDLFYEDPHEVGPDRAGFAGVYEWFKWHCFMIWEQREGIWRGDGEDMYILRPRRRRLRLTWLLRKRAGGNLA